MDRFDDNVDVDVNENENGNVNEKVKDEERRSRAGWEASPAFSLFCTRYRHSAQKKNGFFYCTWLLIAHTVYIKKVTRQQIYGMPTGSVIV